MENRHPLPFDLGTDADQQLKRAMPKISQKMLTQLLRELEKDGVIHRIVYNQVSPKEVCELNEFGWSIKADLDQMFVHRVGEEYIKCKAKKKVEK
jgi:DNA-binding HxlR family transcriptional regulator